MRIDGLRPQTTPSPPPAENRAAGTGDRTTAPARTDVPDLSPRAHLFLLARRAALQTLAARAEHVANLRQQMAAGIYRTDPAQICDALIGHLTQRRSDPDE
jgi:anti-sigma28 factor (negative regulator of flagellin synthesis)